MSVLDVFNSDAFGMVSLSESIDKAPYKPSRLGAIGLFTPKPITDKVAMIEERHGTLRVIQTAARGTHEGARNRRERNARAFPVPYCPQNGAVMADDIQGVREFGSGQNGAVSAESASAAVNDELTLMRQDHEVTHEWHRMGAIKGILLDADGSTIYDYFSIFGVTLNEITNFLSGTPDIRTNCTKVQRHADDALGATPYSSIRVFCGDEFFDNFVANSEVKAAYDRWQDGRALRDALYKDVFEYGGLEFENYRGKIGGTNWMADKEAYAVPMGVPHLFLHHMAPAPFMETVNTRGRNIYVKQKRMDYDVGVELHSNSNPLMICTRPAAITKLAIP